jgi:hypothetical protein
MLKYFGSGPQVKGHFRPCTKSIGKLIYSIIVINLFDLKKNCSCNLAENDMQLKTFWLKRGHFFLLKPLLQCNDTQENGLKCIQQVEHLNKATVNVINMLNCIMK